MAGCRGTETMTTINDLKFYDNETISFDYRENCDGSTLTIKRKLKHWILLNIKQWLKGNFVLIPKNQIVYNTTLDEIFSRFRSVE